MDLSRTVCAIAGRSVEFQLILGSFLTELFSSVCVGRNLCVDKEDHIHYNDTVFALAVKLQM